MIDASALLKTNEGWKFSSETELEDFVWAHLEQLFQLTPLQRQYISRGEICDILAIKEGKQLTILELKNSEDRYIVQQLTRYYDNLIDEKPFASAINFDIPIQLLAVAPSFHKHNFVDCKYSKLSFTLWCFEIVQEAKQLYFSLKDLEGSEVSRLTLPYPEEYVIDATKAVNKLKIIPKPSRAFQKMLDENLPEYKERILAIREKILSFDERIGEVTTAVTARYGLKKGEDDIYKSKLCAEFYSEFFKGVFHGLKFSLWLPFPTGRIHFRRDYNESAKGILKLGVGGYMAYSWQTVSQVVIQRNPRPHANSGEYYDFEQYSRLYAAITGKELYSNFLDVLVDIALEEWLKRL